MMTRREAIKTIALAAGASTLALSRGAGGRPMARWLTQINGEAIVEPTIKAIETMNDLRAWVSLKQDANVARVPLAERMPVHGKGSWAGFDMGDWQYDPWFTEWSQGGHGESADGHRTAANMYNFTFWQYLDISYYFGHELLTIPPLVWTNAAHKNGVRRVGTLNLN
jgi:endo-beta-N-acetylglucosaminidase D